MLRVIQQEIYSADPGAKNTVKRRYAILDVQTTGLIINRQVSQKKRPVFHNLKLLYSPNTVPPGVESYLVSQVNEVRLFRGVICRGAAEG